MSDIAEDMRRAAELRGYTYSSAEIWGLLGRGADEIDRVRAERDFARNAVARKCHQYNADMQTMRIALNQEIEARQGLAAMLARAIDERR